MQSGKGTGKSEGRSARWNLHLFVNQCNFIMLSSSSVGVVNWSEAEREWCSCKLDFLPWSTSEEFRRISLGAMRASVCRSNDYENVEFIQSNTADCFKHNFIIRKKNAWKPLTVPPSRQYSCIRRNPLPFHFGSYFKRLQAHGYINNHLEFSSGGRWHLL